MSDTRVNRMKIGVTSQNFRTVTSHAGKCRRFLVFEQGSDGELQEIDRLDLPKDMSMHEFQGTGHPIEAVDMLITGGCGDGFVQRMARLEIQVIKTGESDPVTAVATLLAGEELPPPLPHKHGL